MPETAETLVLCHGCAQVLPASSFGAGQLKKQHPRCRACAPNKFSNQKTGDADSRRESRAARDLATQQLCGLIFDLKQQVRFDLLPAQYSPEGALLERACRYVADFTYRDGAGQLHVIDAKGMRTDVYRIKRKLMLFIHHIRVEEV